MVARVCATVPGSQCCPALDQDARGGAGGLGEAAVIDQPFAAGMALIGDHQ